MAFVGRPTSCFPSRLNRLRLAPRSPFQFSSLVRSMRFNHPECWREHYDELGGWPENLNHYESGVYIAIHLGDCLGDGRYRVLHKLGNGAFTQVWLAKGQWPGWDLVGRTLPGKLILSGDRVYRGHGYVSIKIVPADASEARILKYLMRCPHHYPGSKNVMKLLDHFTIDTPNMSYEGLVLEVMSMNAFRVVQGAPRGKLSMNNGRLTSRQVARGWNICTNVGLVMEVRAPVHVSPSNTLSNCSPVDRSSYRKCMLYDIGVE